MARISYLIRVKDQTGAKVAEFIGRGRRIGTPGGMQGFTYLKHVRSPGGFSFRVDGLDDRLQYLDLDTAGTLDAQIEFWRRDLSGGAAYTAFLAGLPNYQKDASLPGWYKDFEGFHRKMEFDQLDQGQDQFQSSGRGYNDMLSAETIRYDKESIYTNKNGAAETVLKEYVDENIGPSATAPPRSRSGVMPGLTIEADGGTGNTWAGDRSGKNLLDVAIELAEYAPADYMIVGTGAATFEFQWRYPHWGLDRRIGNTDGNAPLIFSPEYQNATNFKYSYSRLDEINTCDVLGVGKADDRIVTTVTSGGETDSPWNVRAVSRDARKAYDTTTLQDAGNDTLNKQRVKREFSFEYMQTAACRYGIDWDIGTLCTVEYRGSQVDQKVLGVYVTYDNNGKETIRPVLEDYVEP